MRASSGDPVDRSDVRVAARSSDLSELRDETRRASAYECEVVALDDQQDWSIRDGVLSHRSRGFFHVAGAVCQATGEQRLVLHQPQAAITCLALHRHQGRVYVLTQARTEPGNCEQVQYGPTIQSTPANYMGLHGGQPTRHLDCFIDCVPHKARPLAQSSQLDLGNRYFQKIKTVMYVETADWLDTGHDLVWSPLDLLAEFMLRDHFLNIDFRAMLACFDWDGWLSNAPLHDRDVGFVARVPADTGRARWDWRLAGLDALERWRLTPHGVEARGNGDPSVRMYHTICRGREQAEWYQPLYEAPSMGEVVLQVRDDADGQREVLLRRVDDAGLAGHVAWTTSSDRAPEEVVAGATSKADNGAGRVLRSMVLSEEGGRFLRNANRYQIVQVPADIEIDRDQQWVGSESLARILQSSNRATIHLRCAASLILDLLHPHTFADLGSSQP